MVITEKTDPTDEKILFMILMEENKKYLKLKQEVFRVLLTRQRGRN